MWNFLSLSTATSAAMPEIIPMKSVPIETVEVDVETGGASPPSSPQVAETSLGPGLYRGQ